jgi:hypothetical protein
MTDTPEDWVLIEAAKRSGWANTLTVEYLQSAYRTYLGYNALCDMIAKHEQKPVDRKMLCAREANELWEHSGEDFDVEQACLRAIELWEEGFGK